MCLREVTELPDELVANDRWWDGGVHEIQAKGKVRVMTEAEEGMPAWLP